VFKAAVIRVTLNVNFAVYANRSAKFSTSTSIEVKLNPSLADVFLKLFRIVAQLLLQGNIPVDFDKATFSQLHH
jgi:hypothetical protein